VAKDQKYDSNAKSRRDGPMMIIKTRTEPLTLDFLNALLANFATGTISVYELWEQIESCSEDCKQPPFCGEFGCLLSSDMENYIPDLDSEAGI